MDDERLLSAALMCVYFVPEGRSVMLEDDDVLWDRYSGGAGHSGMKWEDGDKALAEAFYADLPAKGKFVFDLMMDRPGERLTADWIVGELSRRYEDEAHVADRRSVSAILSSVSQPHAHSGRRLPFYWWRNGNGPSWYAMKPGVAQLFREARQAIADADDGTWSAREVMAVVEDYLTMLQAEIAGQDYVKARHRRALLPPAESRPHRRGRGIQAPEHQRGHDRSRPALHLGLQAHEQPAGRAQRRNPAAARGEPETAPATARRQGRGPAARGPLAAHTAARAACRARRLAG
jgi:hypothetical protein